MATIDLGSFGTSRTHEARAGDKTGQAAERCQKETPTVNLLAGTEGPS